MRSGNGKRLFENPEESIIALPKLPPEPEPLDDWYASDEVTERLFQFNAFLDRNWRDRVSSLQGFVDQDNNTFVDSANEDNLMTIASTSTADGSLERIPLTTTFENGLGYGESSMTLTVAAAMGRYGNVKVRGIQHEAAAALSESLIGPNGPGAGWAKRVVYSECKNRALEKSVSMGTSLFRKRRGLRKSDNQKFFCVGYSKKGTTPDDSILGHPPMVAYQSGKLQVSSSVGSIQVSMDDTLEERRLFSELHGKYLELIKDAWNEYEQSGRLIGCVLTRALHTDSDYDDGGKLVDPLWQRVLIDFARTKDVPIILDQSNLSGVYWLDARSHLRLLNGEPDVSSYGDFLYGGIASLGTTLITEEVYNACVDEGFFDGSNYRSISQDLCSVNPLAYSSALHTLESCPSSGVSFCDDNLMRKMSRLSSVHYCFSFGNKIVVRFNADDAVVLSAVEKLRSEGILVMARGKSIHTISNERKSKDLVAEMLYKVLSEFES